MGSIGKEKKPSLGSSVQSCEHVWKQLGAAKLFHM